MSVEHEKGKHSQATLTHTETALQLPDSCSACSDLWQGLCLLTSLAQTETVGWLGGRVRESIGAAAQQAWACRLQFQFLAALQQCAQAGAR